MSDSSSRAESLSPSGYATQGAASPLSKPTVQGSIVLVMLAVILSQLPGLAKGDQGSVVADPVPLIIDVNQARESELTLLPGVGGVLAKRIIQFRANHGPFDSLQDLDAVPGIGEKTLKEFQPHLSFDQAATPRSSQLASQ
ncbi:MAG: helix-hairpin-helix domain-containing protein [Planctomycetota bacterium]